MQICYQKERRKSRLEGDGGVCRVNGGAVEVVRFISRWRTGGGWWVVVVALVGHNSEVGLGLWGPPARLICVTEPIGDMRYGFDGGWSTQNPIKNGEIVG